jgi:hypothetical protein
VDESAWDIRDRRIADNIREHDWHVAGVCGEGTAMSAFVCYDPTLADADRRIDVSPPGHEGHDTRSECGRLPPLNPPHRSNVRLS